MDLTIDIPCKIHVRQFIMAMYGTPAELSKDRVLKPVLMLLLDGKRKSHYKVNNYDEYTTTVSIKLPKGYLKASKLYLNSESITFFNNIAEFYIKMMVEAHVLGLVANPDVNLKEAVYDTIAKTNVDINYDMIAKDLQRNPDRLIFWGNS